MSDERMDRRRPVDEVEIHAYIDGLLDPERVMAVEAYLARHPEEAARVESYRRQRAELHDRYDPTLCEPPPPAIQVLAKRLEAAGERRRGLRPYLQAAACLALLTVGAGAGWWWHGEFTPEESAIAAFTRQATDAHLLWLQKGASALDLEVANRSEVGSWLSGQLTEVPNTVPDLKSFGYRLIRVLVLPIGNGPTIQLIYGNPDGKPVSLFITDGDGEPQTTFSLVQQNETSLLYWLAGPLAYGIVGDLEKERLFELGQAVSESLAKAQIVEGSKPAGPTAEPPTNGEPTPVQSGAGQSPPDVTGAGQTPEEEDAKAEPAPESLPESDDAPSTPSPLTEEQLGT